MATIRDQLSEQELAEIKAATVEAERSTGAELVCVIVQRCDTYEASAWKATALGALGGSMLAGIWLTFGEVWGQRVLPWVLIPPMLGAAICLIAVWAAPEMARMLIPRAILERRVDRRAAQAFLEEEVSRTRDRTGVLLFVALFEHEIRILCDAGVEQRVPRAAWEGVVADLTSALRGDRKGPAIAAAVRACGQLLLAHRVGRREDDENELRDEPRLHDG